MAHALAVPLPAVRLAFVVLTFFHLLGPLLYAGLWLIIPARRVLEHEATAVPKTDFGSVQRQLIRFGRIAAPASLGLAVVGALVSW